MSPPFVFPDRLMIDEVAVRNEWPMPRPLMHPEIADAIQVKDSKIAPPRQLTPSEIDAWMKLYPQAVKAIEELHQFMLETFPELKESNRG